MEGEEKNGSALLEADSEEEDHLDDTTVTWGRESHHLSMYHLTDGEVDTESVRAAVLRDR